MCRRSRGQFPRLTSSLGHGSKQTRELVMWDMFFSRRGDEATVLIRNEKETKKTLYESEENLPRNWNQRGEFSDDFMWYLLPPPTITKQSNSNASGCLVKVKDMSDNLAGKPAPPCRVVASLINHEAVSPRRESPVIDICVAGRVPDRSSSLTRVPLTANPTYETPASTPNLCSLRVINVACVSPSRPSTIGDGDRTSSTSPFGTVIWMLTSDTRFPIARHLSVTLRIVGSPGTASRL